MRSIFPAHVNVWQKRRAEFGPPVGPWVKALKDAVIEGAPDDTCAPGGTIATASTSACSPSAS
jgi:ribonuclease Z